jgi:hypothetical protein
MRLIADKRVTYAGRVYRAGVAFAARASHARVLVVMGKARVAPEPVHRVDCIDATAAIIDGLRAEYETRAGEAPSKRWGIKRLQAEIAAL